MGLKISVIGLGYIGLPTSAIFAKAGYDVIGVDVNQNVVASINQGHIHIEEVGLGEIVAEVVANGKFRATTTPEVADVYIIAVPTPVHEDHTANIDYVISAAKSIVPLLKKGDTVIVESTIPPRTIADHVAPIVAKSGLDVENDIYLAHCPERVLPGKILHELVYNTRIVGGLTPEATQKAADVYRLVVKGDIILTDATTAETAKLMENTFRDVNIALANELAKISAKLGVNAHEVIKLANNHPRVNIHLPGPGVGGHCIAVDPYFIIEKAKGEANLIQMARDINCSMPSYVVSQTEYLLSEMSHAKIAVFGLSYKGNIDDFRESPALEILHLLSKHSNWEIKVHDPHIKQSNIDVPLVDIETALEDANLILVLTDHNEFKNLDAELVKKLMKTPVIFDTKNCVETNDSGIKIYKIGDLSNIQSIQSVE